MKNGVDLGDINHSFGFVPKFLPHLAAAVRKRIKTLLSSKLVATGCLPPVNIVADKATHQHKTRQLVGVITLNPGGKNLIEALYLSAPGCPRGDGEYLKDNIVGVTDKFIDPSQYAGSTADGVYEHCKVGEKLDAHHGQKAHFTWDPMHSAPTIDTAMRNTKADHAPIFAWLNELTTAIGEGNKFINLGREYDRFFQVCALKQKEDPNFKIRNPKMFSETKFANWVVIIYAHFRDTFAALLITLEEVKEALRDGSSTERKKAETADSLQGKMYNTKWVLSLSLSIDIYNIYSIMTKILQIVNILPFEKFDRFEEALKTYKKMLSCVDIVDCPCAFYTDIDNDYDVPKEFEESVKKVCYWPIYHNDIRELKKQGTYRGVPMGQLVPEPNRTRQGSQQVQQNLLLDLDAIVVVTNQRATEVVTFLHSGLSAKVFDGDDELIEKVRYLVDVKQEMKQIKVSGAAAISNIRWIRFLETSKFFEEDLFARIGANELRTQYREFNRRFEELSKKEGSEKLTNLEILGKFFQPSGKMYIDIEGVLSILAKAMLSKGVESIVETWVSVLEHHSSGVRGLSQDRLDDEAMVAINGPELVHSDDIVDEAMGDYWSNIRRRNDKEGHFVRRSEHIKSYCISKAVDHMVNTVPRLPYMDQS